MKKTDKKLALSKTTLRRMDLAAVSGGSGQPRTITLPPTTTDFTNLGCPGAGTGYTSAQRCAFTC